MIVNRPQKDPLKAEIAGNMTGDPISPAQSAGENTLQALNTVQSQQVEIELLKAELSRVRKELNDMRDNHSFLYDGAPVGHVTTDNKGIILEVNQVFLDMIGGEKSKLIGSQLVQHLELPSHEVFNASLNNVFSTGIKQSCEASLKRKSNTSFFAGLDLYAASDSNSVIKQCRIILSDITEHKKFAEITDYQDTLSRISYDAILTTDRDFIITGWNKAAELMFGWQEQEVKGKKTPSQIRSKVLGGVTGAEMMKQLIETGSWTGETVCYRKDDCEINVLISAAALRDSDGAFTGLILIFHENLRKDMRSALSKDEIDLKVKERTEELAKINRLLRQEVDSYKQSELMAKESEGKNRDLVDNIKLGLFRCTTGSKGKFLEINQAMEDITGYSRKELLQANVCDLYTSDNGSEAFSNDVSITDWKVTRQIKLKKKNGDDIVVAQTVVAIRYDDGIVQFYDGILEDITERFQAQEQIQQSLLRLQKTIREIIQAMAYIGEVRDPYTAGHQRRVAQISYEIGKMMGLDDKRYEGLTMAAYVHDIGKILVPADILSKPGKLTKPEFDLLKDHPNIGYEILKTIEFPWPIAQIVLQHHERFDGSGYPSGLSGEQIIIEARILAVADVVEAMSSHRPYRPALGIQQAMEEIHKNRGILYDPKVVDICQKLFIEKGFNLN